MKQIAVINGANMNILGIREPQIYGTQNWEEIEKKLDRYAVERGYNLVFYQSNHEGDIVDYIQRVMENIDAILINPSAFSKAGYSILDALNACHIPFVEVHLSNIFAREEWHAESIFTKSAIGCILGFKSYVYTLGLLALFEYLEGE